MSSKKATKVPKVESSGEPKKRAPRAKKPEPTKEEVLKMLMDSTIEIKQIVQDLKEDEQKLPKSQYKRLPELLSEALKNLEADLQELTEEYKEVEGLPEKAE